MLRRCTSYSEEFSISANRFVEWLLDGNFIHMGGVIEQSDRHSTVDCWLRLVLNKEPKMQLILTAMVEENKSLGMPCSSDFSYTPDACFAQQHAISTTVVSNGISKSMESINANVSSDLISHKKTNNTLRPDANNKLHKADECSAAKVSNAISVSLPNKKGSDFKVFLGGSCNPTTWRKDDAIPELERLNIKYYNPQVPGNWGEDLMKEERQAKATAEVLFFVIDNQTRSVASMVEAAHIAGSARKLVLVIKEFKDTGCIRILDEDVSDSELHYLKKGRNFLWNLVENEGYPVCEDIPTALYCTACLVWLNARPQDLRLKGAVSQVQRICDQLGGTSLQNLKNISGLKPSRLKEIGLAAKDGPKILDMMTKFFSTAPAVQTLSKFVDWMLPKPEWCVYLGGSRSPSQWKDVIPLLRNNGINYMCQENLEDDKAALPESLLRCKRKVLLFVITKDTRALAAMMMAAYCVGLRLNVVLCIQYLEDGVVIDGEALTPRAVKDYNRGRIYLRDLAEEANVPIFSEVQDAASYVVRHCQETA